MPIYEYECKACGHRLEALQKISDKPLCECPACAKPDLAKLLSAPGFRLKGGGWYETDFKAGGKKNIAGETGGAAAASASAEAPKPAAGGGCGTGGCGCH